MIDAGAVRGEHARRVSNRDAVLDLLLARGPTGALNTELIEIGGFRYGGRLHELRRKGYEIATRKLADQPGLYRYTLTEAAIPRQGALGL